jgi:hypothetical protein
MAAVSLTGVTARPAAQSGFAFCALTLLSGVLLRYDYCYRSCHCDASSGR